VRSIVAKKLQVKVAHVEAGIRSFDMSMPEEINRLVTDALADYFFTTTVWAGENLKKAGVTDEKIFFAGNVMIDTLIANRDKFTKPEFWDELQLDRGKYFVLTLHRPANVDTADGLKNLIEAITFNVNGWPILFPSIRARQKYCANREWWRRTCTSSILWDTSNSITS
jgi:UDP-N-acetylglucosamine 2-epimerase (non-hydrolysing)